MKNELNTLALTLNSQRPMLAITLVIFAQTDIDQSIDRFLAFLANVMMLIGVVMVFYGGHKIHRGDASDGLMAILGGFIVALAVPIMRFLSGLV